MGVRINHNIPALNSLRSLGKTDERMTQSLERLSTGQRVNRGADGPAVLVVSEQMRGQIASMQQALRNSEASVSLIQTAESGLTEVNNLLVSMRQLAIHAANEGANDKRMMMADQGELENARDSIARIAKNSQFGNKQLFDGSNGANGTAVGEALEFIQASPSTRPSMAEGYEVNITRLATRSEKEAGRPIVMRDLVNDDGTLRTDLKLSLSEGGRNVQFDMANPNDAKQVSRLIRNMQADPDNYEPEQVMKDVRKMIAYKLQQRSEAAGLKVNIFQSAKQGKVGALIVQNQDFGSLHTFSVASSIPGVLADRVGIFEAAFQGRDVEGTIDGKVGKGQGESLMGANDTEVEGLELRIKSTKVITSRVNQFTQESGSGRMISNPLALSVDRMLPPVPGARPLSREEEHDKYVYSWEIPIDIKEDVDGYVHVSQNSLAFQVGPGQNQQVKISLIDMKPKMLGRGIKTPSGFESLADIHFMDGQAAADSMLLLELAISDVTRVRAELGAFQRNTLESNERNLRISEENMISAESGLRDTDMAEEISSFTRNQIMMQTGMAMLAQANQSPKSVLQLLNQTQ